VTGSTLKLTGTGTVVVRALQAGDVNHLPAAAVERSFAVSRAGQTVTFAAVGPKTFGDAPVTLSASSSVGLPIAFRLASGPASLDGAVLTLTGAGSVLVEAVQEGTVLYEGATNRQTVVVGRASQTITFAAVTNQPYRTNPIVLGATASSGLPVAYRVVSGPGSVTGNQLQLSGVGAVTLAADQTGNTNWLAATSVTNGFTVGRGVQEIRFTAIGNQVLGGTPVTMTATSSAGLAVSYVVVSGPATANGNQLALTGAGTVVLRALNPGNPLWLAAQAEQTIDVRRLTTLSVTTLGLGTVITEPLKDRYETTDTVTLKAQPGEGHTFDGWGGALSGTDNPAVLTMASDRVVEARFRDVRPPVIVLEAPSSPEVVDERFRLTGRATDNVGVTTLKWSRDGGTEASLAIGANGGFSLDGLVLSAGTNRIRVTAMDAAGNTASEDRVVVWRPLRVLAVGQGGEVQEGSRVKFPVTLGGAGDVAGLTFRLAYDPALLADPSVEWGPAIQGGVSQANVGVTGEVHATFAMAGATLPEGTNAIAFVSFRTRSVPEPVWASVKPRLEGVSSVTGAPWVYGNHATEGSVRITPRRVPGDNNANQRVDIGDAVVISRMHVGLEERRAWDDALNDLNRSGLLDNGDIVRALRIVVGLDQQPDPRPGRFASPAGGGTPNTNNVVAIELMDGSIVREGRPLRIAVRLSEAAAPVSGLSFTLRHPSGWTLVSREVGSIIPTDAQPVWNVGDGEIRFAAARALSWPTNQGIAAILTLVPGGLASNVAEWSLEVVNGEVTENGFDTQSTTESKVTLQAEPVVVNPPVLTGLVEPSGAGLTLQFEAPLGSRWRLESTDDLASWSGERTVNGGGVGVPVRVPLPFEAGRPSRFWRLVRE
jgi:hypothetical protein